MRQTLQQARKAAGKKQSEIATALKISERFYQHIEAGTREGRYHIWDKLEALFNIPQRELREQTRNIKSPDEAVKNIR